MKLTRKMVLEVLVAALEEAAMGIAENNVSVGEDTVSIGDLPEFDSLTSVEITVRCLLDLGFDESEFPSVPTLFISKQKEALTVGQVADQILKLRK